MRKFQHVLHELKDVVAKHKPGEILTPPPSLPFITVKGRRVTYAAMGLENDPSQPAVILLHGFGGFFMDWPRVMMPVARHTRVYALDLPGWGFSELNTQAKSLEDDVAAVRVFMDELKLERVVLCGISYGAGVAWAAAAMNLPRIQRAVLLNPMPPNPLDFIVSPLYQGIFALNLSRTAAVIGNKMMRKSQYKLICKENLLNERLLETFYLDLAYLVVKQPQMPFILNAHAKGARDVDWADWEHRLAGTRIPVSILQGLNDRIFSFASASHLHELIPHAELIEIPECGHAMVFDQHRKVADFLIQSLARREEKFRTPTVG
ncbi:MAG: alpha/beta hydrolase [Bdellovibrionota bacterium]